MDNNLQKVVDRRSWYIINALTYTIRDQKKRLAEAKDAMKHDDGSVVYRSLEGAISHLTQSVKDHEEALNELMEAGLY